MSSAQIRQARWQPTRWRWLGSSPRTGSRQRYGWGAVMDLPGQAQQGQFSGRSVRPRQGMPSQSQTKQFLNITGSLKENGLLRCWRQAEVGLGVRKLLRCRKQRWSLTSSAVLCSYRKYWNLPLTLPCGASFCRDNYYMSDLILPLASFTCERSGWKWQASQREGSRDAGQSLVGWNQWPHCCPRAGSLDWERLSQERVSWLRETSALRANEFCVRQADLFCSSTAVTLPLPAALAVSVALSWEESQHTFRMSHSSAPRCTQVPGSPTQCRETCPFCLSLPQVSGVGYNGEGNVYLLPSKEILKEFSNVSVGKLVEVSIKREPACPIYSHFSFAQITLGNEYGKGATLITLKWTVLMERLRVIVI